MQHLAEWTLRYLQDIDRSGKIGELCVQYQKQLAPKDSNFLIATGYFRTGRDLQHAQQRFSSVQKIVQKIRQFEESFQISVAYLDTSSERITSVNIINTLAALSFFAGQRHQLYHPFIEHFGIMLSHCLERFGANSSIVGLICDSLRNCDLKIEPP